MTYEFELIEGTEAQIKALFKLLENRTHSISHKKLPTFVEHDVFVKNNPYLFWFLIKKNENFIGTIYIKDDNSIGLNIENPDSDIIVSCINFIYKNFTPKPAKLSLVPDYFYINISASNKELIEIMDNLRLQKLQISFKLGDRF